MKREMKGKKVFVGLSGGVDSSVSAALLKRAGYDVTGVFIKVWQPEFIASARAGGCNSREDRLDAMRVAAKLRIPFRTLNLEKEYKREVVNYMLREYERGNTPNPDAMCNKEIKFGAFLAWTRALGADYVATGHYAKKTYNRKTGRYELEKGNDSNKDQSYFLWTLKEKDLPHVLFPVGGYRKDEVRALARQFGLPTAEKKDSQGLCFVGKVDMKEFLMHFLGRRAGRVVNEKGKVIGTHDGVSLYTQGERHGFAVSKKTPADKPYYVIGKNVRQNELVVSMEPQHAAAPHRAVQAVATNFLSGRPDAGKEYTARFRYRGEELPCTVLSAGKTLKVALAKPDYTISKGQSLVLYEGNRCVGGGIIV